MAKNLIFLSAALHILYISKSSMPFSAIIALVLQSWLGHQMDQLVCGPEIANGCIFMYDVGVPDNGCLVVEAHTVHC